MSDFIKIDSSLKTKKTSNALKAETERLLDLTKNDPLLWSELQLYGIDEEIARHNIFEIRDFAASFTEAQNCHQHKKCMYGQRHEILKIKLDGDIVKLQTGLCPYSLDDEERSLNLFYDDFPSSWKDVKLLNWENVNQIKNQGKAIIALLAALNGSPRWIYLSGDPRVGKSFLATAFVNSALDKKMGTVAYINTARRFKEINDLNFSNKEEFNRRFNELVDVDILVLDSFGDEYINDFLRDTVVIPLLSERDEKRALTIFTSSHSLDNIALLYAGKTKAGAIRGQQLKRLITANIEYEINITGLPL